jgi:hypothetical protein
MRQTTAYRMFVGKLPGKETDGDGNVLLKWVLRTQVLVMQNV